MPTRGYRALTEAEIQKLRARADVWKFKLSDLLGITFLTVVFYIGGGWCLGRLLDWSVRTLLFENYNSPVFGITLPIIGLIPATISLTRQEVYRRKAFESEIKSMQSALSDGRAEVVRCEVTRAAQVSEYEDEGARFFLEVAPNLLVYLWPMDYEQCPSTSVTMTRVAPTRDILDVEWAGQPVEPCRQIVPQARLPRWLSDGLILYGQIEEIPNNLLDWPAQTDVLDDVVG